MESFGVDAFELTGRWIESDDGSYGPRDHILTATTPVDAHGAVQEVVNTLQCDGFLVLELGALARCVLDVGERDELDADIAGLSENLVEELGLRIVVASVALAQQFEPFVGGFVR